MDVAVRNRLFLLATVAIGSTTLAACAPPNVPVSSAAGPNGNRPTGPVRAVVHLIHGRFAPSVVTIRAGQAVQWLWSAPSLPANVTFPTFHSATMDSGTYYHTFDTPGTYDYLSTVGKDMVGTVVVTG